MALSYVWGKSSSDEPLKWTNTVDALPLPDCPKTITDAIDVTLILGKRYFWIDRYCYLWKEQIVLG